MSELKNKITRKYLIALIIVGLLDTVSFTALLLAINFNKDNAYLVNISGRQGMLSQRITLILNQIENSDKEDNSNLIEEAQNNKIDHIIKKLNLKPNQKVLDIGSGWGSLAIEIAKKSQCEVLGVTLSENQYKHSVEKAKASGLENQVRFSLTDYRDLNEKFDRIVSVGMFEHVGRKFYKTYFNSVSKLLNEDGVALIHTIGWLIHRETHILG